MRVFAELLCLPRPRRVILLLGALASLCMASREARAQAVRVEGTVRDARGAAVAGADVGLAAAPEQAPSRLAITNTVNGMTLRRTIALTSS